MSLSERLRPDVEAAPWVIEEVKKLEEKNKYNRQLLELVLIESNRFKGTEAFCLILNLIQHELEKEKKTHINSLSQWYAEVYKDSPGMKEIIEKEKEYVKWIAENKEEYDKWLAEYYKCYKLEDK